MCQLKCCDELPEEAAQSQIPLIFPDDVAMSCHVYLDKTREVIRGQRRQKKYKDLLEEYCQCNLKPSLPDLAADPDPPAAPLTNIRIPLSPFVSSTVPVTQVFPFHSLV
ncbi:hypothetical protein AVEN_168418-1 [Araneus ventricosus]|uniref:Uncharacterized protein n=1 Tax=Araneus ventricosus TaxID=182803 RepID=A0A4Y2NCV9_ARAVE|nr:hypothetical protein AVEN_168418-1 [Araneus ventricosus]